jgi:hypothetical protein
MQRQRNPTLDFLGRIIATCFFLALVTGIPYGLGGPAFLKPLSMMFAVGFFGAGILWVLVSIWSD